MVADFRATDLAAVGSEFRGEGERLLEHLVATMAQIALEVRRVTRGVGVFEDEAVFLGHVRPFLTPGVDILR